MKYHVVMGVLIGMCSLSYAQSLDTSLDSSTSGMLAQKIRLGIIAENVANVSTFKVEETGQAYRRKYAVLEPSPNGVRVKSIETSKEPFLNYSDPAVTQAADSGFTSMPNVSLPDEMINLSYTEVMYEANVTSYKTTKAMYQSTIDTLK